MTIHVEVTCDKCNRKSNLEYFNLNHDVYKSSLRDIPKYLMHYALPDGKHICANCAYKVLEEKGDELKERKKCRFK